MSQAVCLELKHEQKAEVSRLLLAERKAVQETKGQSIRGVTTKSQIEITWRGISIQKKQATSALLLEQLVQINVVEKSNL